MKKYVVMCALLLSCSAGAQEIPHEKVPLVTRTVIDNLNVPWEILWGPDGWIWYTLRDGQICKVNPETGQNKVLLNVPATLRENNESGLLGMALDPNFSLDPYVYFAQSTLDSTSGNNYVRIMRYSYSAKLDSLISPKLILQHIIGGTIHDGCRLKFDSTGHLFISTGDADRGDTPQDINFLNGKILRMNRDGSIPVDNPFTNNYVWSLGHRNVQGLCFGKRNICYNSEHGAFTDDEINIIEAGHNYGWPIVEGYCNTAQERAFCDSVDVTEPIFAWTPTIAPSGMEYYESYPEFPEWSNSLLLAVLKGDGGGQSYMIQLKLDPSGQHITDSIRYLMYEFGRYRDIAIAPDGRVFISTSNRDGKGFPVESDDRIIELRHGTVSVSNDIKQENSYTITLQSSGIFSIALSKNIGDASLSLFDIAGKLIYEQQFSGERLTYQGQRLSPGKYPFEIRSRSHTIRGTVMVL
jgi:glucose/arabinose dehydrogenase